MDIGDMLKKALGKQDEKHIAVLLLKDHPEIEQKLAFVKQRHKALIEKIEEMEKEREKAHKTFWTDLEDFLVNKKLLTPKEAKGQLTIRDGVLFKVE